MNYLAQKFARGVIGTQQHRQLQPHLTRPERRRSDDGVRGGWRHELLPGDRGDRLILLWGSNARETHPIFFHHLLKGVRNGARLYVVDPRRTASAQWADAWLGLDVGSDIALANAMAREIIAAGLTNQAFIERATTGFDAYRACRRAVHARRTPSERPACPRRSIRELAHAYATRRPREICWTLGITEHHNAVDNVLALINLALLTGHVGR